MINQKVQEMSDRRRGLMLELCEGQINHPVLPILNFMEAFTRCDEALRWLVRNKISGHEIVYIIRTTFNNSQLNFVKWVLSRVDKDKELKPIIVGRDYKV